MKTIMSMLLCFLAIFPSIGFIVTGLDMGKTGISVVLIGISSLMTILHFYVNSPI